MTSANTVELGLGTLDSIDALVQQPGMAWINQLASDPKLAGKVDWVKVEEAHQNWNYSQQGLTPATAAATAATGGVAAVGEGGFIAAGGLTISSVVGGAVTAGVSALAGQAAVALINNKGDIDGALHDLGGSASVHNLLTAIATGGVLGGMNLNPTGLPMEGTGAQRLMAQLGQNLQAGVARAVIDTAINGGSLEDSLGRSIKTAFIDTAAAQGAFAIGDMSVGDGAVLNDFTNKVAHAIAGCAAGAVRTDTSGGCSAGAIGAAVGEMAAEAYGRQADTTQFAAMMSAIAAAVTGANAAQINVASQAGANAAANNYVSHSPFANVRTLVAKENARLTAVCDADCSKADFARIDAQMQKVEAAAQYLETQRHLGLTTEQAFALGEGIAVLLPIYGRPMALYQALTGESLSGARISLLLRDFSTASPQRYR